MGAVKCAMCGFVAESGDLKPHLLEVHPGFLPGTNPSSTARATSVEPYIVGVYALLAGGFGTIVLFATLFCGSYEARSCTDDLFWPLALGILAVVGAAVAALIGRTRPAVVLFVASILIALDACWRLVQLIIAIVGRGY